MRHQQNNKTVRYDFRCSKDSERAVTRHRQ